MSEKLERKVENPKMLKARALIQSFSIYEKRLADASARYGYSVTALKGENGFDWAKILTQMPELRSLVYKKLEEWKPDEIDKLLSIAEN